MAEIAARALNSRPGGVKVVGWFYPGFCSAEEMSRNDIIDRINSSGADFLVVALGSQKGNLWLQRNHHRLRIPVRAHFGATLNFQAGTVARAPSVMQKLGLEWLWRIKEEPYLWKRYWNDGRAMLRLLLTHVLPFVFWTWWLGRRCERTDVPRLTLGHVTLAAKDLDRLSAFYCDVLGFQITNCGAGGEGLGDRLPVSRPARPSPDRDGQRRRRNRSAFLLVDHLAFQTGTLDDCEPYRPVSFEPGSKGSSRSVTKRLVPLLQRLRRQWAGVFRGHTVPCRPTLRAGLRSRPERRGDPRGYAQADRIRARVPADASVASRVRKASRSRS